MEQGVTMAYLQHMKSLQADSAKTQKCLKRTGASLKTS